MSDISAHFVAYMKRIYTGIDIGTYHVKVVISEPSLESGALRIIGTGTSTSKGMRHGYIINAKDATKSISEAVERAERAANVKVKSARIAIGGVGLDEIKTEGEISLTQSGGEVTIADIERVIRDSEQKSSSNLMNKKVVHAIPISYKIDGKTIIGRPLGLRGSKLSVEALLITSLEQHLQDLIDATEAADIEVEDIMAAPLAASLVSLTKPQKMAGVVLANIGAETVSIVIFENDIPVSIKVLPMGSSDITNDIALSLQVPLTEAEQMKRGAITKTDISRKKVDTVVASRLKDIFGIIDAHLKSIGRQRLLPAGIVITGGGSGLATARDIAKATMKIPSQFGTLPTSTKTSSADATWAVAFGLCKWGYNTEQRENLGGLKGLLGKLLSQIVKALHSLLP
jgi:cell division protein FtsA